MKKSLMASVFFLSLLALTVAGCKDAPGKPKSTSETQRPEEVLDFPTLYQQNCSACHGANGSKGAAISLSNAIYLAAAGEGVIEHITANGVPGTLMPAFTRSNGGMLTDRQVAVLAHGMIEAWGKSSTLEGQTPPPYASASIGDAVAGHTAFKTFCARCHGADGTGISSKASPGQDMGSIVDPAYLALVSDQSLRSTIIAGKPEDHMPDWRADVIGPSSRAMTNQEITDTVAWLASQRSATPGQPYQQHQ
jgi:cytochrome c oxidase cbb3-type subunit 3/ubiquinol-cytochrome c reductase cytochrome c subunit